MSKTKMSSRSARFVLAVRRSRRGDVPADWIARIRRTEGIFVKETISPDRIFVTGPPRLVQAAYAKLSDYLFLEEEILHDIA